MLVDYIAELDSLCFLNTIVTQQKRLRTKTIQNRMQTSAKKIYEITKAMASIE